MVCYGEEEGESVLVGCGLILFSPMVGKKVRLNLINLNIAN